MELVSVDEAAAAAKIGRRTILRWLADGRLTRHGTAVRTVDGVTRARTMVDVAELLRVVREANPRYFGSRHKMH